VDNEEYGAEENSGEEEQKEAGADDS